MRLPRHISPYGNNALLLTWEDAVDPTITQGILAYAEAALTHPAISDTTVAPTSLLLHFAPSEIKPYHLQEWIYDLQPATKKRKPLADLSNSKPKLLPAKGNKAKAAEKSLITLECVDPGSETYLVDAGRAGMLRHELPISGAADQRAAKRARKLLELPATAVLMEFTENGGQWLISGKGQLVLTGADLGWRMNGRPAETYTTIDFDGDYILDGKPTERGQRAYLAIRGKWQVPKIHGSVSPGAAGIAPLRAGWTAAIVRTSEVDYSSDLDIYQHCPELPLRLKVLPGPEFNALNPGQKTQLLATTFRVANSSRQELRLKTDAHEPFSTLGISRSVPVPNLPATLLWTQEGPVISLKDAPTISKHQRLFILAAADDLDQLGQLRPDDELSFFI